MQLAEVLLQKPSTFTLPAVTYNPDTCNVDEQIVRCFAHMGLKYLLLSWNGFLKVFRSIARGDRLVLINRWSDDVKSDWKNHSFWKLWSISRSLSWLKNFKSAPAVLSLVHRVVHFVLQLFIALVVDRCHCHRHACVLRSMLWSNLIKSIRMPSNHASGTAQS